METLYENYDGLIVKCVPYYYEILRIITDNIKEKDRILDIGIGTGNLEDLIFQKFPQIKIIGVDPKTGKFKLSRKALLPKPDMPARPAQN